MGAQVWLKAENLQRGGAFKLRGATNRIEGRSDDERDRGVCAVSSGNHAQAVAIAAGRAGLSATIVMPEDAPAAKLAATRGYGAEVVTYDRYGADRESLVRELAAERGLTLVHPYDDELVMAGQGTAALELLEEVPELDAAAGARRRRRAGGRLRHGGHGAAAGHPRGRRRARGQRRPPPLARRRRSGWRCRRGARSPTASRRRSPAS